MQLLERLGLQEFLRTQSPIHAMRVWDKGQPHRLQFDHRLQGKAKMGLLVSNVALCQALLQELQQNTHFSFINATLQSMNYSAEYLELAVLRDNGDTVHLQAACVIGAEGAQSWVRSQLGIDVLAKPYDHLAMVAKVHTEKSHEHIAWQCFAPSGPLALLPLNTNNECSIVWSQQTALAEASISKNADRFSRELTEASEGCLGELTLQSEIISFPLWRRHATHYIGERVALIGDAIHTFHPLAGQGMNMGIQDAEVLCRTMIAARKRDKLSWFERPVLRKFERERKRDNLRMIAWMELFYRLYGMQDPFSIRLRRDAIQIAQSSPWVHRCLQQL